MAERVWPWAGDLLGYKAEKKKQATGCSQADPIEANAPRRIFTAKKREAVRRVVGEESPRCPPKGKKIGSWDPSNSLWLKLRGDAFG